MRSTCFDTEYQVLANLLLMPGLFIIPFLNNEIVLLLDLMLLIPILLSLSSVRFFASGYIQYQKNKSDVEMLQNTIREAVYSHLCSIMIAILGIVLALQYSFIFVGY